MAKTRDAQISHAVLCQPIANCFLNICQCAVMFKTLRKQPNEDPLIDTGTTHPSNNAAPSSYRFEVTVCSYADETYISTRNGISIGRFRFGTIPFLSQGPRRRITGRA